MNPLFWLIINIDAPAEGWAQIQERGKEVSKPFHVVRRGSPREPTLLIFAKASQP
jgi:hypothetical protein